MILKKLGDEYKLYSHDSCIATTHESPYKKLSLKNCQAIENGYDLDELADEYYKRLELVPHKGNAYISGFQKALEILRDKKFGEEDIHHSIDIAVQWALRTKGVGETYQEMSQRILQSLQQTEFDVEVVIECGEVKQCECSSNENCLNPQPKLDEDGCLILKRK